MSHQKLLVANSGTPSSTKLKATLFDHHIVDAKDKELVKVFDSPEEASEYIRHWALASCARTEGPRKQTA